MKVAPKTKRSNRPSITGRAATGEPPLKVFKATSVGDSVTVAEAVAVAAGVVSM